MFRGAAGGINASFWSETIDNMFYIFIWARRIIHRCERYMRVRGKNFLWAVFKYDDYTPLVPLAGFPSLAHSPVSSLPCSYGLPTDAAASIFLRKGFSISWIRSVFVGEVTQVNSISVSPIQTPGYPVA